MERGVEVPNVAVCRTRHAYGDFWACLVDYDEIAYRCPYLVGIDRKHYCMHHSYRDFAVD